MASTSVPSASLSEAVVTTMAGSRVLAVSLDAALSRALEGAMPCLAESIVEAIRWPPPEAERSDRASEGTSVSGPTARDASSAIPSSGKGSPFIKLSIFGDSIGIVEYSKVRV